MKPTIQYILYILEHKKNVIIEGHKIGIHITQLLKHDLSKFSKAEFSAYKNNFFPKKPRVNKNIEQTKAFQKAWKHHQQNNKHHWQYWIKNQNSTPKPLEMPEKYVLEMIADWRAMSRKFKGKNNIPQNTLFWYQKHAQNMLLHPKTKQLLENKLKSQ